MGIVWDGVVDGDPLHPSTSVAWNITAPDRCDECGAGTEKKKIQQKRQLLFSTGGDRVSS